MGFLSVSPTCYCPNGLRGGSRGAWDKFENKYKQQLMRSMNLSRGSRGMLHQEINSLRLNLEAILTEICKCELTASSTLCRLYQ